MISNIVKIPQIGGQSLTSSLSDMPAAAVRTVEHTASELLCQTERFVTAKAFFSLPVEPGLLLSLHVLNFVRNSAV